MSARLRGAARGGRRPPDQMGAMPKQATGPRASGISSAKERAKSDGRPSGVSSSSLPSLPDEMWMKIFSYLDAGDLLHAACVCRLWYTLSSSNFLWRSLYRRYVARVRSRRSVPAPEDPPLSFWRKACISSCIEFRDTRALSSLKDLDPFSGLAKNTAKAIQQAGIHFRLALVDGSGSSHFYDQRDGFYHSMSIAVRWYALNFVPVSKIVKLRVYAACPVVFDHKGDACRNSPCQMTLLDEKDFTWVRDPKGHGKEQCGSDSMVNTYVVAGGFVIATWKDGGELSYLALNLPLNNLVQRCLPSSAAALVQPAPAAAVALVPPQQQQLQRGARPAPRGAGVAAAAGRPMHRAAAAVADRSYAGLHTCQCAVEVRSYRKSFFKEQFLNLDYHVGGRIGGGGDRSSRGGNHSSSSADGDDQPVAITVVKDSAGHSRFRLQERPQLTWATDIFKNVTPDMCILDLTLVEGRKVIWCISYPAKLQLVDKTEVSFDRPGKEYAITWSDHLGSVSMELSEEADDALLTVKHLIISLQTPSLLELLAALVVH